MQSTDLQVGGNFSPTIYQGFNSQEVSRLLAGQSARRFQSNIAPRLNLPFVGRDDLLDRMQQVLSDESAQNALVLHGLPGVGKSGLAREYARRYRHRYPGGTFFVDARPDTIAIELARIGQTCLGLDLASGLRIEDQGLRTLHVLAEAPSLLILDDARADEAVRPWLPPSGMPCHVLITSIVDCWDLGWQVLPVERLSKSSALELIESIAGTEVTSRYGDRLATLADGLPVQLVPASRSMYRDARRGRIDAITLTLSQEAAQSFRGVYAQLDSESQLLLHAAANLNWQHIIRDEIKKQFVEGIGWLETEFQRRLDTCLDLGVLEGTSVLRMHQLLATFVLETGPSEEIAESFIRVVAAQSARLVEIAEAVSQAPNLADRVTTLMAYPVTPEFWRDAGSPVSMENGESIGRALANIGQFAAARGWFERAAVAKEKGDDSGRVDHESASVSLHQVGHCLSSAGDFVAARPWFERAVAESEQGDLHGRVDHASLGVTVHEVGCCLSNVGDFAAARPWFERAVAEIERGDLNGRVDHASLGISLHQVGHCLSNSGEFLAARPWFERAVTEAEQGGLHGRVDHADLGVSLHQVGHCLSSSGDFVAARPWFERAVVEKEKGDIHGRVDHGSLGMTLHQTGYCLLSAGDFAGARPWLERAVAEGEQGDIYGRIDHESLSTALHLVGHCLSSTGDFVAARLWYERAVAEAEQGDVHGRVDWESLGRSLHLVGACLSSTDQFATALPWYERAVASKEKGDIHGRVDHDSLATSLRANAICLRKLGKPGEAQKADDYASKLEK